MRRQRNGSTRPSPVEAELPLTLAPPRHPSSRIRINATDATSTYIDICRARTETCADCVYTTYNAPRVPIRDGAVYVLPFVLAEIATGNVSYDAHDLVRRGRQAQETLSPTYTHVHPFGRKKWAASEVLRAMRLSGQGWAARGHLG
ncbi:hypothetical protein MRX96_029245 [Rhipicephalus microplus]